MGRKVEIINKPMADLAEKELLKLGKVGYVANRLQAIKSAYRYGIKITSEILDIDRSSLFRWAQSFKSEGIKGLERASKPSRSKLQEEDLKQLGEWLKQNANLTLKAIVIKLKKERGVDVGKSTIHRALRKLELSHITPRPMHHKSSLEAKEAFKKNSKK